MTELAKRQPAAAREQRDIEWLVNWALEKQGLGFETANEAGGRSRDIPTGMRVDGGGGGDAGRWTHNDAMVILKAINTMRRDPRVKAAADMVATYGRAGIRPDWGSDGTGKWELVRKLKGGRRVAIKRYSDQRQCRGLIGFEWQWIGHQPEQIDVMMVEYAAWHAALIDLRNLINQHMNAYTATGPVAPDAPWDVVPGRVLNLDIDEDVNA